MSDEDLYEELSDVISLDGFIHNQYSLYEDILIRPRMEEAGFYAIHFSMGELHHFDSLVRIVTAIDNHGTFRKFMYELVVI